MSSNVYSFPGAAAPRAAGWLERVIDGLAGWRNDRRKRKELETMDDALLADIGLTREDIPDVVAGRR